MEQESKSLKIKYRKLLDEKKKLEIDLKDQKSRLIESEKEKDEITHTKDE